jgi:hypothetical protein
MELEQEFNEKLRTAQLKFEQDNKENQRKNAELVAKLELEYTKLELQYNTDIPGQGMGE